MRRNRRSDARSSSTPIRAGSRLQTALYLAGAGPCESGSAVPLPRSRSRARAAPVRARERTTETTAALASAAGTLLGARRRGLHPPRLVDSRLEDEYEGCDRCAVAEACVRGDSGFRLRLERWHELQAGRAGGARRSRRSALAPLAPPRRRDRARAMSGGPPVPLSDEDARRLARERFDVPVLLEAGAGTGKTRALVERLLAWTLDAGWREAADRLTEQARTTGRDAPGVAAVAEDVLDGVVAITFTDAAAAEMASRLGTALGEIAAGESPRDGAEAVVALDAEVAAARAATLLDRLGRARIQTIHAFCRGLLAEHPFEAGLHPAFVVDAEETELQRIATETVTEQLTLRLRGDGDPELLGLLAADVEAEEILEAVLEAARSGVPVSVARIRSVPGGGRRGRALAGRGLAERAGRDSRRASRASSTTSRPASATSSLHC